MIVFRCELRDFTGGWVDCFVVILLFVSGDFFEDVACDVRSRLEGKSSDGGVALGPELAQEWRGVEDVTLRGFSEIGFVLEVVIEDGSVKVRATRFVAVFAGHVEPDAFISVLFAQALHEKLEVPVSQVAARWKVILVVSEGEVAIRGVHLGFVHAPGCPLAGFLELAADTLAARKNPCCICPIQCPWVIASHARSVCHPAWVP